MWKILKRYTAEDEFREILTGPFHTVDDATRFAYRYFYDLVDSGLRGGPILIKVEGPCKPMPTPFLPVYGTPRL